MKVIFSYIPQLSILELVVTMPDLNLALSNISQSRWVETAVLKHSLKKRRDSLETRAVYIEISLVSWNLPNGPKHRGSILKNMASSEGDQLLAGAFHAIMGKIEAGILQIAKKWNWKWIFMYQGYFFRKIPATNASFAPKYMHL